MLNDSKRLSRIREIAKAVCAAHRLDLVDARFVASKGPVLQVLIERPGVDPQQPGGGATLEDCQAVSRDLSTALDVEEQLTPVGGYRLEVGSPGVERPLFGLDDYRRFAGREVRLQTSAALEGRRRFGGKLLGVSGDAVRLDVDGREWAIPHGDIAKANLVFRF